MQEGSKFCINCGVELAKLNDNIYDENSITCRKCGHVMPKNTAFCSNCGCKLISIEDKHPQNINEYPLSDRKKSKKSNVQRNIITIFMVAFIFIAIFFTMIIIIGINQKEKASSIPQKKESSQDSIFWISAPKINFENELNKIITDYYAPTGVDAKDNGYLLVDYNANDYSNKENGISGTFITAKYGPKSIINLTMSLNADGDIISIYTFYPNPGVQISIEQLMGIYSNLALTAVLQDKKYADIDEQLKLIEKILKQNPDGEQKIGTNKTEAILIEGNCEYTLSMS